MNKMLKYKEFVNFLNENSANMIKWVALQQAAYRSFMPNGRWIDPGKGEILRADLGSDPEDTIEKYMTLCGIMSSVYSISTGNYSGKFDSYELKFNSDQDFFGKKLSKGEKYGIVNAVETSKSGVIQVIGDKDLTPDKLGLAGDYAKQAIIIDKAKSAIRSKVTDPIYQEFCLELIDVVSNYSPAFNSVDDVEGVNQDFSITHDFSKYIKVIDPKSINTIQKDFGEVLGGIFMFGLIKQTGTGLSFPKESNLELVDFFFNGLAVSSKAGHGAKASATGYINAINRSMAIAHWVPTAEENEAITNVLKPLSTEPKERANSKYLTRSRSSATFSNTVNLFNIHLRNTKNSAWNLFLSSTGLGSDNINRDDIIQAYIDLKDKGNLYKFLHSFISSTSLSSTGGKAGKYLLPLLNAKNEKQASDALDAIIKDQEYDILIGIIMCGCSKQLQGAVNDKYSSTITSIINKSLSVKQLYLDAKIGKGLIKFGMRAMENSDFVIGTLNGIDSWSSRAISIYMKK
jgi:hypothetical protein